MSTKDLAKKIVTNLTKSASSNEEVQEKEAEHEKDLFGFSSPESVTDSKESSDEDSDTDLFGYKEDNKKDRDASNLPPAKENSDEHDEDSSDLDEDLDQGEDAKARSDDHYTGSGEGQKL